VCLSAVAAEGALLGLHKFDELFSKKDDEVPELLLILFYYGPMG